jgi:hypothetical protein
LHHQRHNLPWHRLQWPGRRWSSSTMTRSRNPSFLEFK